ncbi:HTTM domain-containing protein [Halorarius halobius]|uniref:HTTM domain-containing protein n=1 Tax=Halorarius halobius TaxID=2962671 RepID=UPI0020CD4F23|nr:HTTM domain-containing protein [Halorarius halobius]
MTDTRRIRGLLADRLGVDPRALAAFRIGLGVVLLLDLALRAGSLTAFYTDRGVLPRSLLRATYPTLGELSLHALFGALWWQALLFALTALVAVALVAGVHSRAAAVVAFVLVVSLHLRNPPLLNAGDSLLRRLLLWGSLVPLGARWGYDAAGTDERVLSVATVGLYLQVLAVYVVNAVLKLRGDAWHAGTAVRYVFGVDALTVGLGDLLAGQATLLTVGAYAWLALLVASPLLLVTAGRARTLLVGALVGGHLFMLATLRLGVFPLVSVVSLLPFLPASVWDRIERHARPLRERLLDRVGDRRGDAATVVPATVARLEPPSTQAVAAVLLAFVLAWNAASLGLVVLPGTGADTVDPEQRRWDMFAPVPVQTDAYYVTVGETAAGKRVDLFAGAATASPSDVDATYPGHRWYLYQQHLRGPGTEALRDRFGAYLCERWDRRHDSRLVRVEVTLVTQQVRLDGAGPTRRETLADRPCPG